MGRTLLTRLSTRFLLFLVVVALLSTGIALTSSSVHAMSRGTMLTSSSSTSFVGEGSYAYKIPNIGEVNCNNSPWDVGVVYNINGGPHQYERCFLGTGYTGVNPNIYGVISVVYYVSGWVRYYDNQGGHTANFQDVGQGEMVLGCPPFCYHGTVKLTQVYIG